MRLVIFVWLALVSSFAVAQPNAFQRPAEAISRLVLTPAPPTPLVHATSGHLALLHEEQVISMDRLLAPRLGLAGFRLEPVTRISGIEPMVMAVDIINTQATTPVTRHWQPPGGARLTQIRFSPDGQMLSAFQVETGHPTQLVVYDIGSGKTLTLSQRINAAWDNACQWSSNRELLCQLQRDDITLAPLAPAPIALEHRGKPLPTRTYSNLLETPDDDARFEYYFSSVLSLIDLQGNTQILPIQPGIISRMAIAPDGQHLLLRRIEKPYPRMVNASQFPNRIEVWNLTQTNPIYQSEAEGFGIETRLMGQADPGSIHWKPGVPAVAGYLFREDKGNGVTEYQWRQLQAPFTDPPRILVRHATPIRDFGWTSAGTPWFVASKADSNDVEICAVLKDGIRILWQVDRQDRYQSSGTIIKLNGDSGPVLEVNGDIFLASSGLQDSGPRPYLDRINLHTGTTRRLFTAEDGVFETVLAVLDPGQEVLLTRRETETLPPAYNRIGNGTVITLYRSPNPYPQLDSISRQQISYQRKDGVRLTATLYLPKRNNRKPWPTLVWIYPREFSDPQQAEQLDTKPFQFHRIKGPSPIAAVLAGYAVVVNPTVPIISDTDSDDEQYLPQLVSSAEAAVDYLVDAGISDPARIAIGGRSYGAFSSANLLIHSKRFAAGIAMSGAYNRTLTPFGFQHEKRTFWQETDYYTSISPFFHANQIKQPLLLVHGGADPNPGTPKLQARRFFHALSGEGATVRYVELPGEEHHYRGQDTVLHATWEMIDWLDRTIGPNSTLQ